MILPLQQLISTSFNRFASNTALSDDNGQVLTYIQLGEQVHLATSYLAKANINQGHLISIYGDKNISTVCAIYATLLSGNAYLPIDARAPLPRILNIVQSAKPSAIIVQNKYLAGLQMQLQAASIHWQVFSFTHGYTLLTFNQFTTYPNLLAYILFTSGSTGLPKGIMHTQTSCLAFLNWCQQTFSVSASSTFISIAPFQFDLSIFDLFVPLLCGGHLFLPSESALTNSRKMAELISTQNINILYATPSFFDLFISTARPERHDFSSIKNVLIAGEVLHWSLVKALNKHFTQAQFFNLYGPTETNVCTYYAIDFTHELAYPASVPIGKPCIGNTAFLKATEMGSVLCVAGSHVMLGYVQQPDACFEKIGAEQYYNTGDIVTTVFDSNLAYLARADRMIKKNGYRIEPAEVERILKELGGVTQCYVISNQLQTSVTLIAFIVAEQQFDLLYLKSYCAEKLPTYMIPDRFIFLNELPLTANHKIDTAKLLNHLP